MIKPAINKFFEFPETVNEVSARFVAAGVFTLSFIALISIQLNSNLGPILNIILIIGFLARVSSGPKWSPLAIFVTKILVPNLKFNEKIVPGPPKRFAQAIGLAVSTLILLFLVLGIKELSMALLIILMIFAFLESALGFCFGCKIFGSLIKLGIIPKKVCEKCANYSY
jgi:hypothetical protein